VTADHDGAASGRATSAALAFGLGVLVGRALSTSTTSSPPSQAAQQSSAAAPSGGGLRRGSVSAAIVAGLVLTSALYFVLRYATEHLPTEDDPLWGTGSIDEFGGIVYVTWVLALQVATLAFLQAADWRHQTIALAITTVIIFLVLVYADHRWPDFATPLGIAAALLAAAANGLTILLSPSP
jgi:hypothetical protein